MEYKDWFAEVCKRITQNEGRRYSVYDDSMGIPTIGDGFNCNRSDADEIIAMHCGGMGLQPLLNGARLTDAQCDSLRDYCVSKAIDAARGSLTTGSFDALSDARRFVIVDLVYNLGSFGWQTFAPTRALISAGAHTKNDAMRRDLFGEAADHLAASLWASQVGERAVRDIEMMRSSTWVPAA